MTSGWRWRDGGLIVAGLRPVDKFFFFRNLIGLGVFYSCLVFLKTSKTPSWEKTLEKSARICKKKNKPLSSSSSRRRHEKDLEELVYDSS